MQITKNTTTIIYTGRREHHKDVTYGSGEWARGQTKIVDAATAAKMLRHPDVYRAVEDSDGVALGPVESVDEKAPQVATEQDAVQEAVDAIQTMGPDALCAFVERNFQQKLDRRKSAGNLRIDAANLVHQFGMA